MQPSHSSFTPLFNDHVVKTSRDPTFQTSHLEAVSRGLEKFAHVFIGYSNDQVLDLDPELAVVMTVDQIEAMLRPGYRVLKTIRANDPKKNIFIVYCVYGLALTPTSTGPANSLQSNYRYYALDLDVARSNTGGPPVVLTFDVGTKQSDNAKPSEQSDDESSDDNESGDSDGGADVAFINSLFDSRPIRS